MKRDDRPRQSKPRKPLAEGAAPPPVCSECAFVFTEEAVKRGARLRKRKDGTVRCQEDRACRSRQLTTTLGKELEAAPPQDWLFFRFPRALVYARMDVRPKNWKETGWKPRYQLADRVLACILYHSWCYPVSLPFSVQLAGTLPHPARREFDDDEILLDPYKQPRPLRLQDVAVILNEHKTNVSARGIKRLVATKDLRVDEDSVFYPAAKLAEMTIIERQALYLPDHLAGDPDDELRGVPKRYRKLLVLIETHLDEVISTDIFREVREQCSTFNDGLRVLRTARDTGIEQACSRGTTLLPALETSSKAKPSVSPRASISARAVVSGGSVPPSSGVVQSAVHAPPSIDRSFSGVVEELDEQTKAILGKGALAKLDRAALKPRTTTDRLSGADNPFTPILRQWMESTLPVAVPLEDRELDQIAATIGTDKQLEQFQQAAKNQKAPRGWKVYVKIALECQKHHEKYKQAASGVAQEEPYIERRARELIEARKKEKEP